MSATLAVKEDWSSVLCCRGDANGAMPLTDGHAEVKGVLSNSPKVQVGEARQRLVPRIDGGSTGPHARMDGCQTPQKPLTPRKDCSAFQNARVRGTQGGTFSHQKLRPSFASVHVPLDQPRVWSGKPRNSWRHCTEHKRVLTICSLCSTE